jgi:hypothetical protein
LTVPVAMVTFLAQTRLGVEMRMSRSSRDRNIRVLGGGLMSAQSGQHSKTKPKTYSFNKC